MVLGGGDTNDALAVDIVRDMARGEDASQLQDTMSTQKSLQCHHPELLDGYSRKRPLNMAGVLAKLGLDVGSTTPAKTSQLLNEWFVSFFTRLHSKGFLQEVKNPSNSLEAPLAEIFGPCVVRYKTVSQVLTLAIQNLSRHRDIQRRLYREIKDHHTCPSAISADSQLDLRQCIIIETLRLCDRGLPRVSPSHPVTLGSFTRPGRTRVLIPLYASHRNPRIFMSPDKWDPMRWIDTSLYATGSPKKQGEKGKPIVGSGLGNRTCGRSDLAMYEMLYVLDAVYSRFESENIDGGVRFHRRE